MTIFDGRIDLWVSNKTPGLIDVWTRNPDEFFFRYYGVPYDPKLQPLRDALVTDLGTPNTVVSTSGTVTGNCGGEVGIRLRNPNGVNASSTVNKELSMSYDFFLLQALPAQARWIWQLNTIGNQGCGAATPTSIQYTVQDSRPPYIEILPNGFDQVIHAPIGSYPALTTADLAVISDFLAGLAAIQYAATGGGGQQIAQLVGQVAQVQTGVTQLTPRIVNTEQRVTDLGPPLAEVQLGTAAILLKLEDILDCTCRLVVEDCDGDDRVGLKEALKVIIGVVCQIQQKLGYSPGKITVPGTPPRDLLTVREALSDIMRRVGFDNPITVDNCGEEETLENVEQAIQLVGATLGYSEGLDSVRLDALGNPIPICNVAQSFAEVFKQPVNVTQVDGFERFDQPYPLLKLIFSAENTYRHDHQITIAGVEAPPSPSAIREAVDSYRVGDWLCRIYLATSRKLEGWYEDKETGWAHLKKIALLSSLVVRDGEDVAIFQPANSPQKWRGRDLLVRSAFWSDTTGSGLNPVTIYVR